MQTVEIYTRPLCPYCTRARQLLQDRGIPFSEINIQQDSSAAALMQERSGRTSVPQIFIGNHHVGGSDDLAAVDQAGELYELLTRAA